MLYAMQAISHRRRKILTIYSLSRDQLQDLHADMAGQAGQIDGLDAGLRNGDGAGEGSRSGRDGRR